jgi:hypothetical protein
MHIVSIFTRDGREESITRVLLVTNELAWWTGKLKFAYTHTDKFLLGGLLMVLAPF